ncbi:hypothetical protein [Actinomadura gamaensis]|uniref:Uncharacterized protein n=1 Tax=Actinomadura gamaensis TaxID=1763541 RepID=A0ABV9TTF1_9ACTN
MGGRVSRGASTRGAACLAVVVGAVSVVALPAEAGTAAGTSGARARAANASFVDRLGCGDALHTIFSYNGVNGSSSSSSTRLPAYDAGYPDASLSGAHVEPGAWETINYPAGHGGSLDPHWQGQALLPDNQHEPLTATYDLGYAQRLFFSVVDLDAYEHLHIVGYHNGKPVVPKGIPRGGDNPKVSTGGGGLDIADTTGVIDPGPNDFAPSSVVDVVFDEPVDKVVIVSDGDPKGTAAITRFFGCRDTAITKKAGKGKRVSSSRKRVTYAFPYTVTVRNPYGNMPARPRVTDDVARVFGKGKVVAITETKVSGPRPACTPVKGFFARKSDELLPGAGYLAGGQKCTISYVVKVSYPRCVNPPRATNTATLYEYRKSAVVDRARASVNVGPIPCAPPPPNCRCRPFLPASQVTDLDGRMPVSEGRTPDSYGRTPDSAGRQD